MDARQRAHEVSLKTSLQFDLPFRGAQALERHKGNQRQHAQEHGEHIHGGVAQTERERKRNFLQGMHAVNRGHQRDRERRYENRQEKFAESLDHRAGDRRSVRKFMSGKNRYSECVRHDQHHVRAPGEFRDSRSGAVGRISEAH